MRLSYRLYVEDSSLFESVPQRVHELKSSWVGRSEVSQQTVRPRPNNSGAGVLIRRSVAEVSPSVE